MIKRIITLVFLFAHVSLFAQDEYQLPDRELNEVEITAKTMKYYSQGAHIQSFDSATIQLNNDNTLASFLRDHSSAYIREYGAPGQLTTVSLRGTSPENTAIIWNGINLNSLTLGQLDMSSVNIFYFDNMDLHYGSGAAQYGSGAVGGTIILDGQPTYRKNSNAQVEYSTGSFGQQFIGVKAELVSKKWRNKITALYQKSDNDYTFTNRSIIDTIEKQNNAGFWHKGILYQSSFKPTDNQEVNAKLWYTEEQRDIQPSMANNNNPLTYNSMSNSNFRGVLDYKYTSSNWVHLGRVAFIKDNQYSFGSFIGTERIQGEYSAETSIKKINFKGGVNAMHIWPNVSTYPENTQETRASAYVALRYDFNNRLNISTLLRQTIVTGYSAPFTPSLSLAYKVVGSEKNYLNLKSSIARSYRVPTLNERYWGENANPNIRPEDGYNFDLGYQFIHHFKHFSLESNTSLFYIKMYDRIEWVPEDPTYARNIKNSLSQGIETDINFNNNYSEAALKWMGKLAYSFTDAKNLDSDKQLIYVPNHLFKTSFQLGFKGWVWEINTLFTGERTTTDDYDIMPSYNVINSSLRKAITINKIKTVICFKVNNLLDEEYQNYKNYSMPGRNYTFKINFSI
ncbi:TonB-dependent receptor plug domain-containing protein [Flammeovirga yaeyamensis]|uniref:TonB-dependent receptor plug domain-containing protein n=1 Tax=Flammeovirga yaeyamensis TaxID=367791 RepID=A0AAX1MYS6_9BACT|nr:TonB-dependent receptor plug domain-containing protein [Flammeovirga yaeyamensis]MBB3696041.1 iron complex outermembrane receptor protein [Flammeovirga yaeyamensis]NMF34727.1 TonB-dependent receptor [Flammeovirga yaeyamensis]QWG00444.1 TonB-dependent receptor plug domain-containing protein [Flammeovirga yaeyamensis]